MSAETYIIYDGECPFCSSYVGMVRLRESIGPVRLINARDGGPEVQDALARGYDLDDGMVLFFEGAFYHGDECVHRLAMLSSSSGVLNKLNAAIFRSKSVSKVLYAFMRTGRNIVIRMLGRKKLGTTPGQAS